MTNYKLALFMTILLTFISACTSLDSNTLRDSITRLNEPHRIIKHDFSQKYTEVGSVNLDEMPPKKQVTEKNKLPTTILSKNKEQLKDDAIPQLQFVDISFFNESTQVVNEEKTIKEIEENIDADFFLIIGHSHGMSNIGVETLASKRARNMSAILIKMGIPREHIYFISSWSDGGQRYSLSKGVRIIGLHSSLSEHATLITGIPRLRS